MKNYIMWLFIGLFISTFSYAVHLKTEIKPQIVSTDSTAYYKAKCDSLTFLASQYEKFLVSYENERVELTDSIAKLKIRPLMSVDQFVKLYKYDRLLKYYTICKKKPTQWKFYKGWSTRVFEE